LFLLQRKLDEIKKARRNINLFGIIGVIAFGLFCNFYGLDFPIGLTIAVGVGFVVMIIGMRYNQLENSVIWEIQQMAGVSAPIIEQPIQPQPNTTQPIKTEKKSNATIMVLGVIFGVIGGISVFYSGFFVFGLLMLITGIVLYVVGLKQSK